MQNDKLLPCPFCGGEAEATFICDGRYNQIKCKTSKCIMNVDMPALYKSKEEAIEKWNTRKPMERIVEQLENHKNCYEKVIGQVIVDNYDINLERVDLMNCAIDIVRKGGVDNAG